MGTQLKARPTEYKGVRFRSKSEAVFARCLDLSPRCGGWTYEPEGYRHPWDFCIQMPCSCCHCNRQAVIEYKPSAPTETYIREASDAAMLDFPPQEDPILPTDVFLVWGSPWNTAGSVDTGFEIYPLMSSHSALYADSDGWYGTQCIGHILGITPFMSQDAKSYRFDLLDSGNREETKTRQNLPMVSKSDPFYERFQACEQGMLSLDDELQLLKDVIDDNRRHQKIYYTEQNSKGKA